MTTKVIDLRAKRTKASAPRSLFGTMVEIKDPEALHEERTLKPKQKKQKPDKLAKYMTDDANKLLEETKLELEKQEQKVHFHNGKMKDYEHKALHFEPNMEMIQPDIPADALTCEPKKSYSPYRTDVKLNSRDISLAEQFNKLGFAYNNSHNGYPEYIVKQPGQYNYERYRPKPDNSNFTNSGNIFGTGGLFTYRGKEFSTVDQTMPYGPPSKKKANQQTSLKPSAQKSTLAIQIPDNIRAIHGAQLCRELLKDEERVKRALHLVPTRKKKTKPDVGTVMINHTTDPMYKSLGNALRSDIFNGPSYGYLKSLNTASYTDDIPKRSTETFPPKFGVQRNADSKWNEDNVLRQRMKKAWDEMAATKLASKEAS